MLKRLVQQRGGHESLRQDLKATMRRITEDENIDIFEELTKVLDKEQKRRDKAAKVPDDPKGKQAVAQKWQWNRPSRWSTRPCNRWNQTRTEPEPWIHVGWLPKAALWTHPLTNDIALAKGSDEYVQHLENRRGEAHIVYVTTPEDWTEACDVAMGERAPMTVVMMQAQTHLDDPLANKVRVPGSDRGSLECRACWVRSIGEAPLLETKQVVLSTQVRDKFVTVAGQTNRSGYVIRLTAPASFHDCSWDQWNATVDDPGANARRWCQELHPDAAKLLGDTWSFKMQGNDLTGLLRVKRLDVAAGLIHTSGAKAAGLRWYVQGVSEETIDQLEIAWLPWQEGESWAQYAERARRQESQGVVAGRHQLGLRPCGRAVRPG